ncbi:hypothetical protein CY35_06G009500 [Sphagnum magellanicum]|nr:hypothetical protein CY35_06G009500 [Sphagnum magellanicum]
MIETLLEKLLALCEKLSVSTFCRRRLAVILVRLNMAENMQEAVAFVEQGFGPDMVTDPAFLVTQSIEDFVTWVDTSKIKSKVLQYNDCLDDYELLN